MKIENGVKKILSEDFVSKVDASLITILQQTQITHN